MIRFHAFRTDIPEVLNTFDIYTLPSLWEGLPIGMLEAMAMRKAIVATPVDGTKEAILEGQMDYWFPVNRMKHSLRNALTKAKRNAKGGLGENTAWTR